MRMRGTRRRQVIAVIAVLSICAAPGGEYGAWWMLATVARAQSTSAPPPTDAPWPRRFQTSAGGIIVMYEPQIATWDDRKVMSAYAAVSFTPASGAQPLIGSIEIEADTNVSVPERLVDFSKFRVVTSHFATATTEQTAAAVAALTAMPVADRVISLDRVLAYYDASTIRITNVDGVKGDPPAIFYSSRPAVVVNLDGAPVWSPIDTVDLRYVVNTNWDLFEHTPTKTYYLRNGETWLKSMTLATGAWTAAGTLPASFSKLPADDNWKEVKAAVPGKTVAASALPQVFVSETPAELILLRGAPQYVPVKGTGLQWVRNTDADVFRVGTTGTVVVPD